MCSGTSTGDRCHRSKRRKLRMKRVFRAKAISKKSPYSTDGERTTRNLVKDLLIQDCIQPNGDPRFTLAPHSGFFLDEPSGYYCDAATGFYYGANTGPMEAFFEV